MKITQDVRDYASKAQRKRTWDDGNERKIQSTWIRSLSLRGKREKE